MVEDSEDNDQGRDEHEIKILLFYLSFHLPFPDESPFRTAATFLCR